MSFRRSLYSLVLTPNLIYGLLIFSPIVCADFVLGLCVVCLFVCFSFFWPCHMACGILVPQPGIEPRPSKVRAQSLNHWTTRQFLGYMSFDQTHVSFQSRQARAGPGNSEISHPNLAKSPGVHSDLRTQHPHATPHPSPCLPGHPASERLPRWCKRYRLRLPVQETQV